MNRSRRYSPQLAIELFEPLAPDSGEFELHIFEHLAFADLLVTALKGF